MNDDQHPQNPIVAMATKLRARRDLGAAIDSAVGDAPAPRGDDAADRFIALGDVLATGARRLGSILGSSARDGITVVRMPNPPRIRVRFRTKRIALDLDAGRQLVLISGDGLEGEYQFVADAGVPALVNLSKLSTDEGYREPLTGSAILKRIAADAELPRPAHLDEPGPMRF